MGPRVVKADGDDLQPLAGGVGLDLPDDDGVLPPIVVAVDEEVRACRRRRGYLSLGVKAVQQHRIQRPDGSTPRQLLHDVGGVGIPHGDVVHRRECRPDHREAVPISDIAQGGGAKGGSVGRHPIGGDAEAPSRWRDPRMEGKDLVATDQHPLEVAVVSESSPAQPFVPDKSAEDRPLTLGKEEAVTPPEPLLGAVDGDTAGIDPLLRGEVVIFLIPQSPCLDAEVAAEDPRESVELEYGAVIGDVVKGDDPVHKHYPKSVSSGGRRLEGVVRIGVAEKPIGTMAMSVSDSRQPARLRILSSSRGRSEALPAQAPTPW